MKKIRIALLGGLLIAEMASADTIVPGGNVSGTWTASGSPYLVQGKILVPSGQTLTIQPGVQVIFQGSYEFANTGRIGCHRHGRRFNPLLPGGYQPGLAGTKVLQQQCGQPPLLLRHP